jgi:hypothetical protein
MNPGEEDDATIETFYHFYWAVDEFSDVVVGLYPVVPSVSSSSVAMLFYPTFSSCNLVLMTNCYPLRSQAL